jgi:SH3-like domain-containing protein
MFHGDVDGTEVFCVKSRSIFARLLSVRLPALCAIAVSSAFLWLAHPAAAADDIGVGPVSKLPMPRFVSLKADSVNLREGPNRDHPVKWIFKRAGLPVEITAEFEQWRRIRDSEGTEGWVLQNLLSGRRTALVAPWLKDETVGLYERPDSKSAVVARLEPKVLAAVRNCANNWCRLKGDKFDGYMQEDKLWGVYPHETVE